LDIKCIINYRRKQRENSLAPQISASAAATAACITASPPPSAVNMNGREAGTNAIIACCGILSYIFCPFILGIVAWIMGKGDW
jgi:hypothetical protein